MDIYSRFSDHSRNRRLKTFASGRIKRFILKPNHIPHTQAINHFPPYSNRNPNDVLRSESRRWPLVRDYLKCLYFFIRIPILVGIFQFAGFSWFLLSTEVAYWWFEETCLQRPCIFVFQQPPDYRGHWSTSSHDNTGRKRIGVIFVSTA